eukprot:COSAG05_NODE_328_length_11337_cov_252.011805_1_plen_594_part_10
MFDTPAALPTFGLGESDGLPSPSATENDQLADHAFSQMGDGEDGWCRVERVVADPPAATIAAIAAAGRASPSSWMPDEASAVCLRCGADFGALRRRHHCRCCGWVICDSCSSWAPLARVLTRRDVPGAGFVRGTQGQLYRVCADHSQAEREQTVGCEADDEPRLADFVGEESSVDVLLFFAQTFIFGELKPALTKPRRIKGRALQTHRAPRVEGVAVNEDGSLSTELSKDALYGNIKREWETRTIEALARYSNLENLAHFVREEKLDVAAFQHKQAELSTERSSAITQPLFEWVREEWEHAQEGARLSAAEEDARLTEFYQAEAAEATANKQTAIDECEQVVREDVRAAQSLGVSYAEFVSTRPENFRPLGGDAALRIMWSEVDLELAQQEEEEEQKQNEEQKQQQQQEDDEGGVKSREHSAEPLDELSSTSDCTKCGTIDRSRSSSRSTGRPPWPKSWVSSPSSSSSSSSSSPPSSSLASEVVATAVGETQPVGLVVARTSAKTPEDGPLATDLLAALIFADSDCLFDDDCCPNACADTAAGGGNNKEKEEQGQKEEQKENSAVTYGMQSQAEAEAADSTVVRVVPNASVVAD